MRLFLHLGAWEFSPGLIPTLAVILLLPLLLSLGIWQLHRAVAKQQLLDQFALRSKQAPQSLTGNQPLYTPVRVTGHYDNNHPILLDNRIVNHQIGYDVLLPFIPTDGGPAILVNMGWISRAECHPREDQSSALSCQALEDYLRGNNPDAIVGLVQTPAHNLVLAHPKTEESWPFLTEDIRINELSQTLNRPLYPFILLLSGPAGFAHHWEIVTSVTPARHRGYAVQWFALALTLIILYFGLNIRRSIDT